MSGFPVALTKCDGYSLLNQAFEELKEKAQLKEFEKKVSGKKVLVKPNFLGPFRPELAVTTYPELVRIVVRWLKSANAEVLVGDNAGIGGYGYNERSAKKTGILEASEGAFQNIAKEVVEKQVDSRFFKKLIVSKAVLSADYIVNLPKLKTHSLAFFTLGIKNMFGILAGASKSQVHNSAQRIEEFGEALVDIYQIRPPDLTILDGIIGMDGNGPSFGRVRPIGYLVASENALAVDLLVAKMAGAEPKLIPHLKFAMERGLGPKKSEEIEVIGEFKPIPGFRFPTTLARNRFASFFINRFIYKPIINSKLVLNPNKCNSCKNCYNACPSGAMNWKNDYPEIDYKICIRCMCCFELCEQGAWEIAGFLKRMVSRGGLRREEK